MYCSKMPFAIDSLVLRFGLLLMLVLSSAPLYAQGEYVVGSLTDTSSGDSSHCPEYDSTNQIGSNCNLRDAIAAAAQDSGSIVLFSSDLFSNGSGGYTPQTYTLTGGQFDITSSMTIDGPGAEMLTINAGGSSCVFVAESGATVGLLGMTVSNGSSPDGGAVYIKSGATIAIYQMAFSSNVSNSSNKGGGAISNYGSLTVSQSVFNGNTANGDSGSGACGGAIADYHLASASVDTSTFSNNSAAGCGGAIYNDGTLTVTNSTFFSNSITMPSSASHYNQTGGGGIANDLVGALNLVNDTFSVNNGGNYSDDLYDMSLGSNFGAIGVSNVIMADGFIGGISECVSSDLTKRSLIAGSTTFNGHTITASDISLAPLGNYGGLTNTMPLLPGSKYGLCGGVWGSCPFNNLTPTSTDQRGDPRPTTVYGGSCVDVGSVQTAYSIKFTTSPSSSIDPGQTFSPAPVVQLYEQNVAFGAAAPITLSLYSGTLSGTVTVSTDSVSGAAGFGNIYATPPQTLTGDWLIASAEISGNTSSDTSIVSNRNPSGSSFSNGIENLGVSAKSGSFTLLAITSSPSPGGLPSAQDGVLYSQQFSASNGTAPYTYTYSGSLPSGISLSTSGMLSGTPTSTGSYSFNLTITDSNKIVGILGYTLPVSAPTMQVTSSAGNPTSVAYGGTYSGQFTANGGTAPYTYSISSGSLPPGLSISPTTGAVTGSTTQAGNYSFTVSAMDSSTGSGSPFSAQVSFSITVTQLTPTLKLSLTSGSQSTFIDNAVTFSATLTATAGTPSGSVTFYDGGAVLCSAATLSGGVATCQTNAAANPLSVGSHSITISYSGDTNFVLLTNSASPVFTETVADFAISTASGPVTIMPGRAAQFSFTIAPVSPSTVLPSAIKLTPSTSTVAGLPSEYTFSLLPSATVASCTNSCSTTITLVVQSVYAASAQRPASNQPLHWAPISLCVMIFPWAVSKNRRRSLARLLLLAVVILISISMSGCGTNNGYFGQAQNTYAISITGTSGTLSHTSGSITLTVE
jgi:predicted outer membrane repeat protein